MTSLNERLILDTEPVVMQPGEVFLQHSEIQTNTSNHSYLLEKVSVGDISSPEDRERFFEHVEFLDQAIKLHPEWPVPVNGKFIPNPVFLEFYNRFPGQDSMIYWRDNLVPTAAALYPLQRLDDAGRLFPGGVVDDYAMDIFTNHEDGVAIRSRGTIYKNIITKALTEIPSYEITAVALGAGAGVPNVDATTSVRSQLGKRISWKMYDTSYSALELAHEIAHEAGIPKDDIDTVRADYRKAFRLDSESVDIADMLGLMEYLSRERCVEAMGELHRLLKPGGVMVVSNMLDSRPHKDFYQRGIQWPGVKPRSIDDLVNMVAEAGIDTEQLVVTTAEDGIYAVLEVHKR